ncbi:putative chromatin regulatory protein sir2 [Monocercomonoides exilis]|uniref:putative chromatin regulatory protein sir2 n=1 Tax=Monocercomonoides exilis TaxID=2049356 RepID=UPI00355A4CE2|nr:putative chromatin regulatory protein sir2 [Monocercomonoides exilis]|eukprot:MONOS_14330.1-p1 / transcript=MONOS_14330.1 / gene=MONOS_14330 / organism=Monocercomonoides_exilis_PA203 / gene_product=chromatin regulatory protein sir2 / transcript_product=chromatin regulatory protein sir2 / location=Mono_scaffold00982:550-3338(-) / protein_length=820 / sequence_SO=supercontig / SO=protein_coding / is_pseudo=false
MNIADETEEIIENDEDDKARIINLDGDSVTFRDSEGNVFSVDLATFSQLIAQTMTKHMRTRISNLCTLEHAVQLINNSHNIVVITGAGVSVSCGIPDFRSKGGFYDRAKQDGLSSPELIFDLRYFRKDPSLFYNYAVTLLPSNYEPSFTHYFISYLEKQNKLLRNYTQNIDNLEKEAGATRVIQCHGSLGFTTCTNCGRHAPIEEIESQIRRKEVAICHACGVGVIKPDVVFFGEGLPEEFHSSRDPDMKDECDLVIVIGSSLNVQPVCTLVDDPPSDVPQILINRDIVGNRDHFDINLLGDCDDVCAVIAQMLGWDLDSFISNEKAARAKRTVKHEKNMGGEEDNKESENEHMTERYQNFESISSLPASIDTSVASTTSFSSSSTSAGNDFQLNDNEDESILSESISKDESAEGSSPIQNDASAADESSMNATLSHLNSMTSDSPRLPMNPQTSFMNINGVTIAQRFVGPNNTFFRKLGKDAYLDAEWLAEADEELVRKSSHYRGDSCYDEFEESEEYDDEGLEEEMLELQRREIERDGIWTRTRSSLQTSSENPIVVEDDNDEEGDGDNYDDDEEGDEEEDDDDYDDYEMADRGDSDYSSIDSIDLFSDSIDRTITQHRRCFTIDERTEEWQLFHSPEVAYVLKRKDFNSHDDVFPIPNSNDFEKEIRNLNESEWKTDIECRKSDLFKSHQKIKENELSESFDGYVYERNFYQKENERNRDVTPLDDERSREFDQICEKAETAPFLQVLTGNEERLKNKKSAGNLSIEKRKRLPFAPFGSRLHHSPCSIHSSRRCFKRKIASVSDLITVFEEPIILTT